MIKKDLFTIFNEHSDRGTGKWSHYLEIYERHLEQYRDKEIHILEIGVSGGGSLQIWKKYFGDKANIYGVDVNEYCKNFEDDQIKIFIGDQSNKLFLKNLIKKIPKIDIIIDDGGHQMNQQIKSFDYLFPKLEKNGIYICEDTHSSYQKAFGGQYKGKNTFIEYIKNQIDSIHAWHSDEVKKNPINEITKNVFAIHFYDSVVIIEKRPIKEPHSISSGEVWLPSNKQQKDALFIRAKRKFKRTFGIDTKNIGVTASEKRDKRVKANKRSSEQK